MKPVKLGPFLGENNRLERHALDVNNDNIAGRYLAGSQNVELDRTGRLSRAQGTTLVQALTSGRSGFSYGGFNLLADGSALLSVLAFDPFAAVSVDTISTNPVAYQPINNDIYYTDGVKLAYLDDSGVTHPATVPVPVLSVAGATAGDLPAAKYQYLITFFVGDMEGGASFKRSIELDDNAGLTITLPAAPAGVTHIGVYCSGPNGEVPLFNGKVAAGTASATITDVPTGRECGVELCGPMPAGEHLAFLHGRLLVAADRTLYYSEPYNFGLTKPGKNYIEFAKPITNIAVCKDGVYVTADQTWWVTNFADLLGDPVLPYGAVARTAGYFRYENKVYWLSERGLIVGNEAGQVQNMQERALALDLSGTGASVETEEHFITTND